MLKINLSPLQIPFGKKLLFLCLLITLFGLANIAFSAYSKGNLQNTENESASDTPPEDKQTKIGCCGNEPLAEGEFYTLLGTYYSLKDNQTSVLMFNNKAPEPLVVNLVVFNLNGERLDLPALIIPAASYQEFDARDLLAGHLPQFEEGSLQISHQGAKLQLGVQIKIFNLEKGLIFDEQLVQTSKFVSSQLENVWWLPSPQSKTKFIISNTTDSPVTAMVKVDGTAPRQQQPTTIELNPHQTKALDILRDLVGKQQGGTIHKEGGISIAHSGAPGAVLARMFVSNETTGFSSVANFIDPQATRSSKWHGSGYRIGKIGSNELTPILVARNIGNQPTNVSGRISYTNDAGEVIFVNIPSVQIDANKVKTIDAERAVRQSNVPANISHTGLEFEYSTPNGSVVMSALSISRNNNHVFQVPLFDPERMPSSAGGYPWKADGDYTTMLYIKNETDQPQKYTAVLTYQGGNYAVGVKDIKPHELAAIDFRALRDNQTPDAKGQVIPLNVERGEISWSSHGKTNKALSGRSHQSSVSEGVSSTYDCRNCCPNSDIYSSIAIPSIITTFPFDTQFFRAEMQTENCYGQIISTFPVDVYGWYPSHSSIATIESDGMATAVSVGDGYFNVPLTSYRWRDVSGYGECGMEEIYTTGSGGMEVRPRIEIYRNNQNITNITQNVIVGEEIHLSTLVITGGKTISSRQWTVPGTRVANYVVNYTDESSPTSAVVTQLSQQDFQQQFVKFYWVDGGDSRQVQYSVTIDNRSYAVNVTFNVKRPTGTVTGQILGSVNLSNFNGVYGLWFGKTDPPPAVPGIVFSRSMTIPSGFSGDFQWVQTWNRLRRLKRDNIWYRSQGFGLDSRYPYESGATANDSPGIDIEAPDQNVYANESFNMYLMFKPSSPGAIWVPLKKIEWGWSAEAEKINGIWQIVTNPPPNTFSNPPSDVTEHPVWTQNAKNIPYTRE